MGNVNCVRFCPDKLTHFRRYLYNTSVVINNTVQSLNLERDQCVPCPANCLNCNPNNICIFCVSGSFYHRGACVSTCPAGFFNVDSTCVFCGLNCTSCSISGCLTCADGFVLQNKRCYRACANSTTLLVSGSDSCNVVCTAPCMTCYGPAGNNCLSCYNGTFLAFTSCVSVCPVAYYPYGNVCNSCPFSCGTCTNASVCLTCNSGFYLNATQCLRSCPTSTYPSALNSSNSPNTTTNECLPCSSGCIRCSDAETCLVCANNYIFFNFTCLDDYPDYF